jgi:oligopeptide/dipeptide ABC transporter ATP-binding protein
LTRLRAELDLTLVFISHDLAVVRHVCDRVMVMYLGKVVEDRPTSELFDDPRHPYSRALLAAAPKLGVRKRSGESALPGEPPALGHVAIGCAFQPRCSVAVPICVRTAPELIGPTQHERVACHLAWPDGAVADQPPPLIPSTRQNHP